MSKPRLLDLFCGPGGAGEGYARAGFEVIGVDNKPQKNYPHEFYQDDALRVLDVLIAGETWRQYRLQSFKAIAASPPCQAFSTASTYHHVKERHPNLIPATRSRLISSGLMYAIENVAGAPLIKSIMLCGMMFDLQVYRHRYFESNILLFQPAHPKHIAKAAHAGAIPKPGEFWCPVGNFGQKDSAQRAMGIDWMETTGAKSREIAQAIPPAYTRWIGQQFFDIIQNF